MLGVELSDRIDKVAWPLQPLPAPVRPVAVRLRVAGRRRYAPVWFPPRALYRPCEAAGVLARHLAGHGLPTGFDAWPVDTR